MRTRDVMTTKVITIEPNATVLKAARLMLQNHISGLPVVAADGELLDETFADYALENYEIAAYKSLLTLCEVAVQRSIAPLLQETLKEEEAMARWLKDNLSRLTRDYVVECERKGGNGEGEDTGAATKIKPPRPDIGGQRGQGDERDHEPSTSPPRKENRTRRGGAK